MDMRNILLTMALAAILGGCSVRKPIEGRNDPWAESQISFANLDLRNKTALGAPQMERRNGLLYVTVPIRSTSNYDLHVDYRITFVDENGHQIYQGPWEGGKTLVRNVQDYIRFNSPNANAADFRLALRYSE